MPYKLKNFKNHALCEVEGIFTFKPDNEDVPCLFEITCTGTNEFVFRSVLPQYKLFLSVDENDSRPRYNIFYSLDGACALRNTASQAFLVSSENSLKEAKGPLRKDRKNKLFTLEEVLVPQYALQPLPLRILLFDQQQELYLSASLKTNKVVGNAETTCCSEELLLDLHSSVVRETGNGVVSSRCTLWSGDINHVISRSPNFDELILLPQHSCVGAEAFEVNISQNNAISFADNTGNSAVNMSWPSVVCSAEKKPTKFLLELAVGQGTFILTAHGHLAAPKTENGFTTVSGVPYCAEERPKLDRCKFIFNNHGDNIYSIKHVESQIHLCVDSSGILNLDETAVYPDQRMLFTVKLAFIEVPSNNIIDAPDGYVSLGPEDRILGFTIQSESRVHGKGVMLSSLPDGRLTTIYASKPTRSSLFSLVDAHAVQNSSVDLFRHLESTQNTAYEEVLPPLRKCNSMQNLSLNSPTPSLPRVATQPSLPEIPEDDETEASSEDSFVQNVLPTKTLKHEGFAKRRCVSESALSELSDRPFLAQFRHIPKRPSGYGVRSAASLQDLAVRQLCLSIIDQVEAHDPLSQRCSHLNAAVKLATESFPYMHDEIMAQIINELNVLLSPCLYTKISYAHMVKQYEVLPDWAKQLVVEPELDESLPEEVLESFSCVECDGKSNLLLPLDPEINPQHNRFLVVMERRAFGRARNGRRGRRPDGVSSILRLAKHGILFLGLARCLMELIKK